MKIHSSHLDLEREFCVVFFKKNKLKIIIEIKQNKTKKCEITKKEKEKENNFKYNKQTITINKLNIS